MDSYFEKPVNYEDPSPWLFAYFFCFLSCSCKIIITMYIVLFSPSFCFTSHLHSSCINSSLCYLPIANTFLSFQTRYLTAFLQGGRLCTSKLVKQMWSYFWSASSHVFLPPVAIMTKKLSWNSITINSLNRVFNCIPLELMLPCIHIAYDSSLIRVCVNWKWLEIFVHDLLFSCARCSRLYDNTLTILEPIFCLSPWKVWYIDFALKRNY